VKIRIEIDDGGMPLLVDVDLMPSLQELDRVQDTIELLGGDMVEFDLLAAGKMRPKALKAIIFVKALAELEGQVVAMVERHGADSAEAEVARRRADTLTTDSFDCDLGTVGVMLAEQAAVEGQKLAESLPVEPNIPEPTT